MMRPYLAVIKDSFREAMSSRILWILLVLISLVLAALVPLGVHETSGTDFERSHLVSPGELLAALRRSQQQPDPSPGRRVAAVTSPDLRAWLEQTPDAAAGNERPGTTVDNLREVLNQALARADLYEESAWQGIELDPPTAALVERGPGQLSPDDLARLNRGLLEAAWPPLISASRDYEVSVSYLGGVLFDDVPQRKEPLIKGVLIWLLYLVAGVGGILVAILVTASIIPNTFTPGAIDLLLSKPVSRGLVFLSKFFGGCAFTLINATYLLGGIWLILGLRHDLWSGKLLWCIPLYMFLFAIYYAVSALAGVIWRNAIVSVVLTVVFWLICWTTGTVKQLIEPLFLNPNRIVRLTQAGDALLSVNEAQEIHRWDEASHGWLEVMQAPSSSGGPPRMVPRPPALGPLYDVEHQQVVVVLPPLRGFEIMAANNTLVIGKPADGWKRVEGLNTPPGMQCLLLDPQDRVLAITPAGVSRAAGALVGEKAEFKPFGVELLSVDQGGKFETVSPLLRLATPVSAALDPHSGELVVYDGTRLVVLALNAADQYAVRVERALEEGQPGLVAAGGDAILLALRDGRVQLLERADLGLRQEFQPEGNNPPRHVTASPDGQGFAVVFHHGRAWVWTPQAGEGATRAIGGQGTVSTAEFVGPGRLAVATQYTRISQYDLTATDRVAVLQPTWTVLERVYWYGIRPVYLVLPKPGDLSQMVDYLVTEERTVATTDSNDLRAAREKLDIWQPIWSNLAFLVVALAIGWWYVARTDF